MTCESEADHHDYAKISAAAAVLQSKTVFLSREASRNVKQ